MPLALYLPNISISDTFEAYGIPALQLIQDIWAVALQIYTANENVQFRFLDGSIVAGTGIVLAL